MTMTRRFMPALFFPIPETEEMDYGKNEEV